MLYLKSTSYKLYLCENLALQLMGWDLCQFRHLLPVLTSLLSRRCWYVPFWTVCQLHTLLKYNFVFVFSCFLLAGGWEEGGYFFTWQLQNAGETSVIRVKWNLNFHAGESLKMRVTPAQCGWHQLNAGEFTYLLRAHLGGCFWSFSGSG